MTGCGILAVSLWLAFQAAGPGSASSMDAEGLSLLEQGRVSEAEGRFRKALEFDPEDAEALNDLGMILRRRGETSKAVELLQRAVKVRPNTAFAPLNRKKSALACIVGICSGKDSPVKFATSKS